MVQSSEMGDFGPAWCLLLGAESSLEAGAVLRGGRAGELQRRKESPFDLPRRCGMSSSPSLSGDAFLLYAAPPQK